MANRFIELNYTGKLEDGTVFDTTSADTAKEANILNPKGKYGPAIVCLGQGHLLRGLEEFLQDKKSGKYTVDLDAEHAFGKKQSKLIQLIPTKKLTDNNIKPYPGLQLNVDDQVATVKTVSGGRTMVDFNHPLAGQAVSYEVEVLRDVEDAKEKVATILELELKIKVELEEKDGKVILKAELPEQIHEPLSKRLKEVADVEIGFEAPKMENKPTEDTKKEA